ncbi:hypothetical protein [Lysobacter gummosus]|uniref:hypothetical protein n=1 Tax=Lysobacter gummosus TaxID=262324 RepID=UPI0036332ECE
MPEAAPNRAAAMIETPLSESGRSRVGASLKQPLAKPDRSRRSAGGTEPARRGASAARFRQGSDGVAGRLSVWAGAAHPTPCAARGWGNIAMPRLAAGETGACACWWWKTIAIWSPISSITSKRAATPSTPRPTVPPACTWR